MALMDATAQEIVTMARSAISARGSAAAAVSGLSGQPRARTAPDIAEAVMGRDAWDTYKDFESRVQVHDWTPPPTGICRNG